MKKENKNMKHLFKTLPLLALILLFTASVGAAQTTNVTVTVGAEASLSLTATPLTISGAAFSAYTGATTATYLIRTTKVGGTGTINLKVTTDFGPTGGPSVLTPPTAGDALTYTCTAAAPATGCTGTQTALTTATTPVATFGTDAHALSSPASTVLTNWSLTNDPKYQTGAYTAVATYTISAT